MSKKRFNRTTQTPMEYIFVSDGDQALASGALVSGANSVSILDGQLGVLSTDVNGVTAANTFKTAAHNTTQVKSIKVLRGTPNSQNLTAVSPFNLNDKAYLSTPDIFPQDITEITTTLPEVGTYSIDYLSGFSAPAVDVNYNLTIVLESPAIEVNYARERRDINTYSVAGLNPAPTSPTDYVLQELAIQANKQGIYKNPAGKPFIVFGIKESPATVTAGSFVVGQTYTILTVGTTDYTLIGASANTIGVTFTATGVGAGTGTAKFGTTISTINQGKAINYMLADGLQSIYTAEYEFVAALQNARVAGDIAGTESIVNLGANDSGDASNVDALMVVGLKDVTALIFDEETREMVKVEAGATLTNTRETISTAKDWVGTGKQWHLQWKKFYGKQAYYENWYSSDLQGGITTAKSYIDNDKSTLYTSTRITFNPSESHNSFERFTIPHVLTILLPAAISNPTATVASAYTTATTETTTVAALNASLGVWLNDAYTKWTNHEYYQAATPGAEFV